MGKNKKKSKNKNTESATESSQENSVVENVEVSIEVTESNLEMQDASSDSSTIGEVISDINAEITRDFLDEAPSDSQNFATEAEINSTSDEVTADVSLETSGEANSETSNDKFLVTDQKQIEQVLEAVIFAAPKAMSLVRLRNLLNHFNYDTAQLPRILDELIEATKDKGFQLVKVAGGYQYRSHPEHSEVLQKLLEDKPARLSSSALEVLAIIAYKQPVTRADIDSVRGVDSGHLLKGLLEKDLVRTVGHAETAGRPLIYGTTSYFLEVFTLGSLDDLPQMDEVKRELATDNDSNLESTLGLDSSGLAAQPDRGAFDQMPEESIENPDFGLQERAQEELA